MSDFNFRIVGDASAADQAIGKVESGLDGVKAKAKEATDSVHEMHDRLESIGSVVDFIGGAAALGGMKELAEGIEHLIEESNALEDRYTELTNHAMKFAEAGHGVNLVIAEQQALAHQLHADLKTSMELYDRVADATDELGLSARQTAALTQTLGEGALLAGKSFDSAGSVMARLAIATAAGADGAREMKAILRDFPELGKALAEAWNTDKAGVIEMVSSGKKNLQDLTDVWIQQSQQIHDAAQGRKRTHEEERQEFVQTAEILMNQGVSAEIAYSEAGQRMAKTMQDVRPLAKSASEMAVEIAHNLNDQAKEWQRVADRAAEALRGQIVQGSELANDALKGLGSSVSSLAEALAKDGFYAVAKAADPWFVKPETAAPKKIADTTNEINKLAQALLGVESASQRAIREGEQSRLEFAADVERAVNEEIDAEDRAYKAAVDASDAKIKAEEDWRKAVAKATDEAADKRMKLAEQEAEAAEKVKEAWAQGLGSIAAQALSGKASIESLGASFLKLALQIAATQMGGIGGAFLGAFGSSLSLPGHASGTQFMVGGSGGTDQNLVAFRASNDERVTVETPQDRQSGKYFGGGSRGLVINMQNDRRDIVQGLNSRDGESVFVDLDRKLRRQRRR